ncbi:MAG: LexA family transcriptional regulator [Candidatus Latescibacteria bacterium]|nr:LexA family transcriptional regulator [Candidatus Latescibacterota bacterium]
MTVNISLSLINQRFIEVYNSLGYTQAGFAGKIGKSQGQISLLLSGKSNVSPDMIQLLRYKFNVNPNFMLQGDPPMFLPDKRPTENLIPLIAGIPQGPWESWAGPLGQDEGMDYVRVPGFTVNDHFAIRVDDDSMAPVFHPGDILIIDPQKSFKTGIAVISHKRGHKIRNVRKLGADRYFLWPMNPSYDEEEIESGEFTGIYVPVKVISVRSLH